MGSRREMVSECIVHQNRLSCNYRQRATIGKQQVALRYCSMATWRATRSSVNYRLAGKLQGWTAGIAARFGGDWQPSCVVPIPLNMARSCDFFVPTCRT
jgi:hypothetical protein